MAVFNEDTRVKIPATIAFIHDCAFAGCKSLTKVVIPSSVTTIGPLAFGSCSGLTSMEIPESVKEIGRDAFRGCNNLKIHCPNGSYAQMYAKKNKIKVITE